MKDLEQDHMRFLRAEEHLRLALLRITRLEEWIAQTEHFGQSTANSRKTLHSLYDSLDVMMLYRNHAAARYEMTLLMSRLTGHLDVD